MKLSHLSTGEKALHRGAFEIALHAPQYRGNPYLDVDLRVTFTRPEGRQAIVDGFYDGDAFKARAYCDALGVWRWQSRSTMPELDGQCGTFEVVPSALPGKLRLHPADPHQFAYDNGEWFLHIGDTGYRYLTAAEPEWEAYLEQAVEMGATKIRTWFCQGRSDVQILFDETRSGLNLPYWQEIDRRLVHALERYPQVQFKVIPYGEDTAEIRGYQAGDPMSVLVARYAQARFSALPNVHWCITNDREIVLDETQPLEGRQVYARTIDRMGRDVAAREPWGTLLTNHQCRWSGYAFVDAPWSDIITIEDIDQVDGAILLDYRAKRAVPVVNDEDRYETYRPPLHPRYYFRRLMWGSLLSGGHATYGGMRTWEPYQEGPICGVRPYFDAVGEKRIAGGAHDFRYIRQFFADTGLALVGMTPDDALAGEDGLQFKCVHDERTVIIYLANPSGNAPETDRPSERRPQVRIALLEGTYTARWYDPRTGDWNPQGKVAGGALTLSAPGGGDWVLLLEDRR